MRKQYPGPSIDQYVEFIRDAGPNDGPTEFSWGPGLTPSDKRCATPEDGGIYRGTTPRRGRPSARDYDAPGNPGVRVR
jgi:hypothetical protein